MNKEFCTYEQALALKELGFDEPCLAYYQKSAVIGDDTILPIQIRNKASNFNDNGYSKIGIPFCSAPLYQQAFRWFREWYDISSYVDYYENSEKDKIWYFIIKDKDSESQFDGSDKTEYCDVPYFETYEELESACLIKLIEIARLTKP